MQPGPSPDPIPAPPEASSRYRGEPGASPLPASQGILTLGAAGAGWREAGGFSAAAVLFFHGSFTPGLSFAAAEVPQGELEPVSW